MIEKGTVFLIHQLLLCSKMDLALPQTPPPKKTPYLSLQIPTTTTHEKPLHSLEWSLPL